MLNTINHRGGYNHEFDMVKNLMTAINGLRPGDSEEDWDEKSARKVFMEAWSNYDHGKVEAVLKDKSLKRHFKGVVEPLLDNQSEECTPLISPKNKDKKKTVKEAIAADNLEKENLLQEDDEKVPLVSPEEKEEAKDEEDGGERGGRKYHRRGGRGRGGEGNGERGGY